MSQPSAFRIGGLGPFHLEDAMNTDRQPRFTSQQLADQITRHIEELAEETDAARVSEEMLRYLDMCAKFHSYSWCNTWLILLACPYATQVAGFRRWQSLNRFVRKGERGIPILAPILVNEKTEVGENNFHLRGFKVVYVFDISQTDGEPLPELPSWKNPEKNIELQRRLIAFSQKRGITVTEKVFSGEIQGVSRGGAIELSPHAGTATLIHEIAHEMLHKHAERLSMTREEKELEAEAVSYVVGKYFGLEVVTSANYIAMWSGGRDSILAHLEHISKTSEEIINALGNL